MRSGQAGFTLLELVIAIGIALMLMVAGGYWMMSMRPGALTGATDDFDANLAAAKAIAATSGNGATIVFAPQAGGISGFTMRVYSGRPNAANAVTDTNTMALVSGAGVSEKTFGSPPFSIFLNSAGYPTGIAQYPSLDAQEHPTFNVIAQQPPCPAGGIVLTFTNPQGVTATRTLPCNAPASGVSAATATPTPNSPRISPTYLLAHDTSDAGPLRFKAAEYGYYHWWASTTNQRTCAMGSSLDSDTGNPPAAFASPWPYASPSPAAQLGLSPAAPNAAPYTWPAGDQNDPPAWFSLTPVHGNGGLCTVAVEDDFNQSGNVTVQVMGDLQGYPEPALPLQMTAGKSAVTVTFGKSFDSEKLLLSEGGHCLGVVSATSSPLSTPNSPSRTPATSNVTITPLSQGDCTLIVQDQYGEQVSLPIAVAAADQPFGTWPASLVLGSGGAPVASSTTGAAYTGPCYAQAFRSGTSGAIDASLPSPVASALGVSLTSDGCILNARGDAPYGQSSPGVGTPTGVMIAYEPPDSGQVGNFSTTNVGACVQLGSWNPNLGRDDAQALLPAKGGAVASCIVDFSDGQSTQALVPDAGQVSVDVQKACSQPSQCYLTFETYDCTVLSGCSDGPRDLVGTFMVLTDANGNAISLSGATVSYTITDASGNSQSLSDPFMTTPSWATSYPPGPGGQYDGPAEASKAIYNASGNALLNCGYQSGSLSGGLSGNGGSLIAFGTMYVEIDTSGGLQYSTNC